jgi:MFS family permease
LAYFCVYAFRKPIAATTFTGRTLFGEVELKTGFLIAQVIGYAISKYVGVKLCSEVGNSRRGWLLLGLICMAQIALFLFAILPDPYRALAMVLNGLPLGIVWGVVVRYLEGRRTTDVLLAGLSVSYILASGVAKDVARWVLSLGYSEEWMPFVVGAMAFPLFAAAVFLLELLPEPDEHDRIIRGERTSMSPGERWMVFRRLALGLCLLVALYCLLTAFRDFRDNYGVEIFNALGHPNTPALFMQTELPVALCVLLAMALINLLPTGWTGLFALLAIMMAGMLGVGLATWAHQNQWIDGVSWMIAIGIGSYIAYVPFGAVLFERLMTATKSAGTAVFAVSLADAAGYTVAVAIQLHKDLAHPQMNHLGYLQSLALWVTASAMLLPLAGFVLYQSGRTPAATTQVNLGVRHAQSPSLPR